MSTIFDEPDGATPLDPNEMEGLKFKHVTTRRELDHLEQANIQSGMAWMRKNKRINILTESYACELPRRLFGDVWKCAGTFRKTEKNIGIDPLHISVQLRMLLDDTSYWIKHETYVPYKAVMCFHHRLVAIHLFPNGNGRHARIMADAILLKLYKLPPIDWAGGYDIGSMTDRRKAYIQALRAADKGDYQQLFNFAGIEQSE